jgi:hypothetical protein
MKDVTINKVSVIRERAEALVAKHGLTLHAARAQERERCAGILHRALDAAAIDHGEQCVGGCECYENFAEAMMGVEFAIRNPPDSENKEHDDDK